MTRRFKWIEWNLAKLAAHALSPEEVEAAFDLAVSIAERDDGSFEIKNVPVDTKITIVGWHEGAGYFHNGQNGTEITLKKGETKDLGTIKIK